MAKLSAAFALAFGLIASAASAQPPSDQQVVVLGQRQTEAAIRAIVSQMATSPHYVHQLSHWDNTLCPGIAGLKPHYAQGVLDRIAYRAEGVRLNVGGPGCRANTLIIVTMDPDNVARDLAKHHPRALGVIAETGRASMGRRALAAFVNSDAPVRWWHVNQAVSRDGEPIHVEQRRPDTFPVVAISGGNTRLARTTHQDTARVFVIVDAQQLQGVSFEALADYLAMVSLAQLSPDADMSSIDTILNMFSARTTGAPAPAAMTDWDIAYLRGLYDTTRDARNAEQQESEIAHSMASSLQH